MCVNVSTMPINQWYLWWLSFVREGVCVCVLVVCIGCESGYCMGQFPQHYGQKIDSIKIYVTINLCTFGSVDVGARVQRGSMNIMLFLRAQYPMPRDYRILPVHVIHIHRCGIRGGYMQLVGLDDRVMEQIYKHVSISLCPNTPGQVLCTVCTYKCM